MSTEAADVSPAQPSTQVPRTTLIEAMSIARRWIALFTEMPVDTVVACVPEAGGWVVTIDVVEAAARLGDNDLLSTFEMVLSASGEVERYTRLRRYHRDDAASGRA